MSILNNGRSEWLPILRQYFVLMALGNLAWEFAHMPLYTLWETGTPSEIVFAALHCTGGDILIALAALVTALILFGNSRWPAQTYGRVAIVTVAIGLAYTLFSEWLNIFIRASWAYSDLMPIIPLIDAGLSPAAQWTVLPGLAFWWLNRAIRKH
ncbi:MAG: hypothetical protein CVT73_07365 [Alphaproteobacteria bacterium HGW-Alphaproteobacteria-12]|nr:MAG: hypothetical protein CVT73_07365 [Alphaproteobacteria bacterium HGW-Alphaproteobacteria-12]